MNFKFYLLKLTISLVVLSHLIAVSNSQPRIRRARSGLAKQNTRSVKQQSDELSLQEIFSDEAQQSATKAAQVKSSARKKNKKPGKTSSSIAEKPTKAATKKSSQAKTSDSSESVLDKLIKKLDQLKNINRDLVKSKQTKNKDEKQKKSKSRQKQSAVKEQKDKNQTTRDLPTNDSNTSPNVTLNTDVSSSISNSAPKFYPDEFKAWEVVFAAQKELYKASAEETAAQEAMKASSQRALEAAKRAQEIAQSEKEVADKLLTRLKNRVIKDDKAVRKAANASEEADNEAMTALVNAQVAQQTAIVKEALAKKASRVLEESKTKAAKSADAFEALMTRAHEALVAEKVAADRVAELANELALQNKLHSSKSVAIKEATSRAVQEALDFLTTRENQNNPSSSTAPSKSNTR